VTESRARPGQDPLEPPTGDPEAEEGRAGLRALAPTRGSGEGPYLAKSSAVRKPIDIAGSCLVGVESGTIKNISPPPDFGSAHEFGVRSGDATRLEGRAIATGSPNTPHEARARVTPTAAGHEAVASRSTVGSAPNSSSNPRRGGGAASGPARWFGTIRWREGVGWGGL